MQSVTDPLPFGAVKCDLSITYLLKLPMVIYHATRNTGLTLFGILHSIKSHHFLVVSIYKIGLFVSGRTRPETL